MFSTDGNRGSGPGRTAGRRRQRGWTLLATALWAAGLTVAILVVRGGQASAVRASGPTVTNTTTTVVKRTLTEGVSQTLAAGVLQETGAADCTAVINWGDGSSSAATMAFTADPAGGWDVAPSGTHAYSEEGTFGTASAVSTDPDCTLPTTSTTVTTTVGGHTFTTTVLTIHRTDYQDTVLCCEPLAVSSSGTLTATAGAQFTATVATLTDTDPAISAKSQIQEIDGPSPGPTASYSATVDWGDGSTSPGSVATGPAGSFIVSGSHTYAGPGTFTVTVSASDLDLSTGSAADPATVAPAGAVGGLATAPPPPNPTPQSDAIPPPSTGGGGG